MPLLKPPALKRGDVVGVFTPSYPAHSRFRAKYLHGLDALKHLGYVPLEGSITRLGTDQGYRSASPRERAREFMELVLDPSVKALIATIGGYNSSSLIDYLDFA